MTAGVSLRDGSSKYGAMLEAEAMATWKRRSRPQVSSAAAKPCEPNAPSVAVPPRTSDRKGPDPRDQRLIGTIATRSATARNAWETEGLTGSSARQARCTAARRDSQRRIWNVRIRSPLSGGNGTRCARYKTSGRAGGCITPSHTQPAGRVQRLVVWRLADRTLERPRRRAGQTLGA